MSENTIKRSRFVAFWATGLAINLGMILGLYYAESTIGIKDFLDNISLPLYSIIPGTLVLFGIWAITMSDKIKEISKKALILLVISFAFWLAAEQTWNLYEHVLDIDPYPSIADFFYVAAPITMFFSLIVFLKPYQKQISRKIVVFASAVSIAILIPTVIATYTFGAEDEFIEIFVALLYPIVDSVLLVPAIVAISFTILNKKSLFWIGILIGIIVLIAADTIFLFAIIDDTYTDGHPVDILFISSYTIWAFMMYYIIYNGRNRTEENARSKKYQSKKFERYGVLVTIIVINVMVGAILVSMHYYLEINPEENITTYFSWVLIMLMVIFSSFIIALNAKLNSTLQKRTEALEKTSESLIKAERFSAIGTLASRLAHDLRNPLGIIITSNSIIKKKSEDEQILKNTEYITRSVDRMEHQINNVLDFVRVKPLKIENVSIQELTEECLRGMKIPKGIEVKKPENDVRINCDKEQFLIVMYNTIFNSIQKLEDKGVITVTCRSSDLENIIEIQDSGESVPEDIMGKIFEPLFTTKHQGTGLGLASCKQIIEEHKGTIEVKNDPTTMIIKIPKEAKL